MSVCEDNFIVSKVLKYFSDKAVHLVRQLWTSETSVLPQTVHLFPWNNLQLFQQRLLLSAALLLGRKRTGSSLRLPARSYQDFADSSEDHPSSWHHRRCKSMHWVLHLLHLHGKKSHMPLMEHKPLQPNTRARWGESQANELDGSDSCTPWRSLHSGLAGGKVGAASILQGGCQATSLLSINPGEREAVENTLPIANVVMGHWGHIYASLVIHKNFVFVTSAFLSVTSSNKYALPPVIWHYTCFGWLPFPNINSNSLWTQHWYLVRSDQLLLKNNFSYKENRCF